MASKGKRYTEDAGKAPESAQTLKEAVDTIKGFRDTKFDQTVENQHVAGH